MPSSLTAAIIAVGGSHVTFRKPVPSHNWRLDERKSMKRTFAMILAVLAAAALFGEFVYAVLVAAHVSRAGPLPRFRACPNRSLLASDKFLRDGLTGEEERKHRPDREVDCVVSQKAFGRTCHL
jgi:hypothetical protein